MKMAFRRQKETQGPGLYLIKSYELDDVALFIFTSANLQIKNQRIKLFILMNLPFRAVFLLLRPGLSATAFGPPASHRGPEAIYSLRAHRPAPFY